MTLDSIVEEVKQAFVRRFNEEPQWMAAAPGRVNLIGEHTDYNDGFVLPMAIERYAVIAARPSAQTNSRTISWYSTAILEDFEVDASQPITNGRPKWSSYIRGVLAGYQRRGIQFGGFDAVMNSSVPIGGGLSSSAALEVSTATLLEAITGQALDPVDKALLCQEAEHEFAGVPCGIMDQFISVMGKRDHALLIDCRSRQPELVPMTDPSVSILIFNTNVKHELSGGEYAERREHCEEAARKLGVPALRDVTPKMLQDGKDRLDPVVYKRARHVVSENSRTLHASKAMQESNWKEMGQLMYASHESLRDDYEVSCLELDTAVELARKIGPSGGVYGSRMTGGGFGGCTVSLVKTSAVKSVTNKLVDGYKADVAIDPIVFVSRPGEGASIIQP